MFYIKKESIFHKIKKWIFPFIIEKHWIKGKKIISETKLANGISFLWGSFEGKIMHFQQVLGFQLFHRLFVVQFGHQYWFLLPLPKVHSDSPIIKYQHQAIYLDLILWPWKNLVCVGEPPKISLGQKYFTTSIPNDPNYFPFESNCDLKKLTGPTGQWF